MNIRKKVMLLLLAYLTFCSGFFGAVFTGYVTNSRTMLVIGLAFLVPVQLLAVILIHLINKKVA